MHFFFLLYLTIYIYIYKLSRSASYVFVTCVFVYPVISPTPFTCAHLSTAVPCHQSLSPQYLVYQFVHSICQILTVTDLVKCTFLYRATFKSWTYCVQESMLMSMFYSSYCSSVFVWSVFLSGIPTLPRLLLQFLNKPSFNLQSAIGSSSHLLPTAWKHDTNKR